MISFLLSPGLRTKEISYQHPGILCFDHKGRLICHGGIPYTNWGYSKPKGIKYRCWFACNGLEPLKNVNVLQVHYSRVIYIKPDYDQLFTLFLDTLRLSRINLKLEHQ